MGIRGASTGRAPGPPLVFGVRDAHRDVVVVVRAVVIAAAVTLRTATTRRHAAPGVDVFDRAAARVARRRRAALQAIAADVLTRGTDIPQPLAGGTWRGRRSRALGWDGYRGSSGNTIPGIQAGRGKSSSRETKFSICSRSPVIPRVTVNTGCLSRTQRYPRPNPGRWSGHCPPQTLRHRLPSGHRHRNSRHRCGQITPHWHS